MKIQIPHYSAVHGETGADVWLTTDPLGRVVVGVVGGEVARVDADTMIAALEAINLAEDHPMDHPAEKITRPYVDSEESDPASS